MTENRVVTHLEPNPAQSARAYSPAVITQGGRIMWLAGHLAPAAVDGSSLLYDFDGQTRRTFELMEETLRRAGGSLRDIVTMTVFIIDPRHGDRFCEIRKEVFGDGPFPASALLTAGAFGRPGVMVEIQGVAVLP